MRIKFFGTSHGVPAPNRFCSCTLLEVNGTLYTIDAGAPVCDLILREGKRTEDLRVMFTTHFHGDHVGCLYQTADLVNWHNKEGHLKVFLTERKEQTLFRDMIESGSDKPLERTELCLVKKGVFYEDENIRVTAYPTKHLEHVHRPAYSLLVEAEGKKVFFTGDLSVRLQKQDFPRYLLTRKTDLAICEMAHFTPEEVAPYLENCKTKQLLFNHVYPYEKFDAIAAMGNRYGYPISAAFDGQEITL